MPVGFPVVLVSFVIDCIRNEEDVSLFKKALVFVQRAQHGG
jgi:hypothetical protein